MSGLLGAGERLDQLRVLEPQPAELSGGGFLWVVWVEQVVLFRFRNVVVSKGLVRAICSRIP